MFLLWGCLLRLENSVSAFFPTEIITLCCYGLDSWSLVVGSELRRPLASPFIVPHNSEWAKTASCKLRYLPLADTRLFCRGLFQVRWICTMRWWKPLCHVAVSRCLLADLVWSGIRTPRPSPIHYVFTNNFQDHPSAFQNKHASS